MPARQPQALLLARVLLMQWAQMLRVRQVPLLLEPALLAQPFRRRARPQRLLVRMMVQMALLVQAALPALEEPAVPPLAQQGQPVASTAQHKLQV
jgi:hypothetical protein